MSKMKNSVEISFFKKSKKWIIEIKVKIVKPKIKLKFLRAFFGK